jgi:hypothetical protein
MGLIISIASSARASSVGAKQRIMERRLAAITRL